MSHEAVSESLDLNFSNVNNATTPAATVTGSPAGHASLANTLIVRVTVFLILATFNLGGNGFTLITIRLTARLWTKTNFILASMLVSNVITGILTFWYTFFVLAGYVFNQPCRYNVAVAATTPLLKATPLVSIFHLIIISIERYIAIVYPLHYETKFTDRTMKFAIAAAWATGILLGMTFALWLINADLHKCDIIPVPYHLLEVVTGYIPVCILMFFVYGKILAISWRQRKRVDPTATNPAPGASLQAMAVNSLPPIETITVDRTQDVKKPPVVSGSASLPAVMRGETSADLAQQQLQNIKSRRREFKAVYLTAAIVGTFCILWFPYSLGRVMASTGYNPVVVNYIGMAIAPIGAANFAFAWVIYAAVSKSYRRAYRQVLIRIGCCCCKNIALPVGD